MSKTQHSFNKLKILSKPLFAHERAKELIEIAKEFAPASVIEQAKRITNEEEIAKACRWLAIIKRDYGTDKLNEAIEANTKQTKTNSR